MQAESVFCGKGYRIIVNGNRCQCGDPASQSDGKATDRARGVKWLRTEIIRLANQ